MKHQRGFTLAEVLSAIIALALIAGAVAVVWLVIRVLFHLLAL